MTFRRRFWGSVLQILRMRDTITHALTTHNASTVLKLQTKHHSEHDWFNIQHLSRTFYWNLRIQKQYCPAEMISRFYKMSFINESPRKVIQHWHATDNGRILESENCYFMIQINGNGNIQATMHDSKKGNIICFFLHVCMYTQHNSYKLQIHKYIALA